MRYETSSDFDFSRECGAFEDTLYKAFLKAADSREVTLLFDAELDGLNAAGDGMRPDAEWKKRFE